MALKHAPPGTVVHAGALGADLSQARTETLVNEPTLQIFRLVLAEGQSLAEHAVPTGLVIQCLEGVMVFAAQDRELRLEAGDLSHVPPQAVHSVHALTPASALVTLYGPRASAAATPVRSKESST